MDLYEKCSRNSNENVEKEKSASYEQGEERFESTKSRLMSLVETAVRLFSITAALGLHENRKYVCKIENNECDISDARSLHCKHICMTRFLAD